MNTCIYTCDVLLLLQDHICKEIANLLSFLPLGIGRALAIRLNEYGSTVFALSRTKADLDSLQLECPNVKAIPVDLNSWEDTRSAVESCGPVDCVLNVAGIGTEEPFLEITPKVFDE